MFQTCPLGGICSQWLKWSVYLYTLVVVATLRAASNLHILNTDTLGLHGWHKSGSYVCSRTPSVHSFERDTLGGEKISAEDSGRVNIHIRSIRFMHHFHAVSPSWTWFIFLQFLSVICGLLEERSLFVRKAPSLEQPIIGLH